MPLKHLHRERSPGGIKELITAREVEYGTTA